ncbi:hypothetical protein [Polyangium aurulentum]|uniref:hypothetical protein n=1 Tax=Polyangium aurulentum TaxID=2567896 RepID=UPI0010AE6965|nr:hypothetical protein [Polyangium aurulentum]UQA60055.1 hypothetical protein E8A73_006095 [Polyangium aurulentum]
MADPYIDPFETKVYGKFTREQMAAVLTGLVPGLDDMIAFAIGAQLAADQAMSDALEREPKPVQVDGPAVLDEARDVIVRFGAHLDSIKGRPVDPKVFFRGEAPSVIARRRLTKLAAALGHIVDELPKHKPAIRDAEHWQSELQDAFAKLSILEKQQRATRVEKVVLGPEVAAAREGWLAVYNANKNLVRGLLGHAGKPELLPLIFDDLAEVHRASGVSDEAPPEGAPAPEA